MERYKKNIDNVFITTDTQNALLAKTIAVIGCGGQGGYILEFLTRLGVQTIYFWDGDTYNISNLNRQRGCLEKTLGKNKALSLYDELKNINSTIELKPRDWFFGEKNEDIIDALNSDIIIMAADDSYNLGQTREMVRFVIENGVPCIDEWIRGLGGEVSIITNKNLQLWDNNTKIWESQNDLSDKDKNYFLAQPAYRCAFIAAETVNQMVQYFTENPNSALNSTLQIDMYHHKYLKYDLYGQI